MNIEKLSRRDFMKKTTVLTVGIAGMTLFSGLVNAGESYGGTGPVCSPVHRSADVLTIGNANIPIWTCLATGPSCQEDIDCGSMTKFNADGTAATDKDGKVIVKKITVNCATNRDPDAVVVCQRYEMS